MAESLRIPRSTARAKEEAGGWQSHLILCVAANVALWTAALAYLMLKPPAYTSEWAVVLPGAGSSTDINLPEIGQTNTQVQSPYNDKSQDPRENYKFIAESKPVLTAAAKEMRMSPEEFGKPRIKIIDNTTLLTFEVRGSSPQEAQKKSFALYKALEVRLNELRSEETNQQYTGFESVLNAARKKLQAAHKRLVDYKTVSGFSSNDQVGHLSDSIEQIRRERIQVLAQQKNYGSRGQQLSNDLKLSPGKASDAFILQTDPYFQQLLSEYSKVSANVVSLAARYTSNNPMLLEQRAKRDANQTALLVRSKELLGRPITLAHIEQLSINTSEATASSRQQLSQDLVTTQANKLALQAQAQEMNSQLNVLEDRLKSMAQKQAVAEDLQRDVQIAEAVFSSTLASLDIGKSFKFGSYPQTQLLTEPNLPDAPSSPNKLFVLSGATLGSLCLISGTVALRLRKHQSMI